MIAYIDCSAGISGLALLGALLDVADERVDFSLGTIQAIPSVLSLPCYHIRGEVVHEQGMRGWRLTQLLVEGETCLPQGTYADFMSVLHNSSLALPVRERSLTILRGLMEAQAHISGSELACVVYPSQILIEIVGVVLGLQALGIEQLYATPVPLTSGLVEKNGSLYPVPSPLVVEMLRQAQAPWKMSRLDGDLVTPAGAAILASSARFIHPSLVFLQTGCGFDAQSIRLSLYVGQHQEELQRDLSVGGATSSVVDSDQVTVIETHIDTMTGELLGGLMERLFSAGALDVTYTPIQMKKNRPALLLTVISPVDLGEQLALLLLRETSTLGVRIQHIQRRKAQREQRSIDTPLGTVLVKIKRLGADIVSVAPEYEECQRIAREQQMPLIDVYEVVRAAIKNAIV